MKIGRMNNPGKSLYDEALLCGKAGFAFLDLTIEGPHAATVDIDRLQHILDIHDLGIVGHTDPCLPFAYPIQTVRDACLGELERCAKIFAALGATIMNIHPCYFCPPAMRKEVLDCNIEALRPIVAMAVSHGLQLVLENYRAPFDRAAVFAKVFAAVPGLQLHLDFGHAHFGHDNHQIFCRELGRYIHHVHFSDNRGRNDDHMPLGVGSVDWQNGVEELKAAGYDGTITLEVFCNDPAMQEKYLDLNKQLVLDLWR